jgi:hypothetical protein
MASSKEYRQHAEECLRVASGVANPDHKALLLKMAKEWNELAHEQEQLEARAKSQASKK